MEERLESRITRREITNIVDRKEVEKLNEHLQKLRFYLANFIRTIDLNELWYLDNDGKRIPGVFGFHIGYGDLYKAKDVTLSESIRLPLERTRLPVHSN